MVSLLRGIGLAAPGFMEGRKEADEQTLRTSALEGQHLAGEALKLLGAEGLSGFGGGYQGATPSPGQQSIPMSTPIEPGRAAGAQPFYGPYLAAVGSGPGAFYGQPGLEGRPRGSPAGEGLPVQAGEAPNIGLVRERIVAELANNPALQQRFDAITTAEVGQDPGARQKFQEATIMRAVQEGQSLASILENRAYYPRQTYATAQPSGQPTASDVTSYSEPSNASVYATGNASRDPRTGREVGFAGGPQTAASVSPRGELERYGPEGSRGLALAREMGYTGPSKTAIGPQGPGVAEAYAQRGPQGGPQGGAQTSPQGYPQLDMQTLLSRIQRVKPNASPAAVFSALTQMVPLMNADAKMQMAQMRDQLAQGKLEQSWAETFRKGGQFQQGLEFKQQKEQMRDQLARDLEESKRTGRVNEIELAAKYKDLLTDKSIEGRKELAGIIGQSAMERLTKRAELDQGKQEREQAFKREYQEGMNWKGSMIRQFRQENPDAKADQVAEFAQKLDRLSPTEIKVAQEDTRYGNTISMVDDVIDAVDASYRPGGTIPTGIVGRAMRLSEIAGNLGGWSNSTEAHQFETKVEALRAIVPRLLTGKAVSGKDERERMSKIVRGLETGDTREITMDDMHWLRDFLRQQRPGTVGGRPSPLVKPTEESYRLDDVEKDLRKRAKEAGKTPEEIDAFVKKWRAGQTKGAP